MSKINKLATKKNETTGPTKAVVGRKRDDSLDAVIMDAALSALAEVGYDRMTMDLVAEKAKTGKATMYRRWSSKTELVRDALVSMNSQSVNLTSLPDTGSLREDLLTVVKPKSAQQSERKLKVLSGLGSFFAEYRKISEDISAQIFGGWEKANAQLFKRAQERGEISKTANINEACRVISAMTAYMTTLQLRHFNKEAYEELLDGIVLPALGAKVKSKK
ncbi:TetR/AcrR family transcriptional regulator [Bdellovibrio bacteriovorus]|nr:TetR/AcrR family transcriptional regulator [Bdellovibrio bacteriovorus]